MSIFAVIWINCYPQASNDSSIQNFKDKYNFSEFCIASEEYGKAIDSYKELLIDHPDDNEILFRLGFCYLFTEERYNAIPYLEKVVNAYKNNTEKNKKVPLDAYYYLAKSYYVNYDFENAKETFKELKEITILEKDKDLIDKHIADCENAENIFTNPVDIIVTKLGVINSDYPDHSPVISADETILVYTSRRAGTADAVLAEDHFYYEDIYIWDKTKGLDSKPQLIDTAINTPLHEASCGLSIDAQSLFIYKSTKTDLGDIYFSKFEGKNWSEPEKLNSQINSESRESHASISADGRLLYFTSNRKGGFGGMDIYVAEKMEDGDWGNVKNLGSSINTELDEEGPYFHPDGKTLYFSSQAHNTMGGFDVFTSNLNSDKTWTTPVNLGFPLNTVDNDVFYIPTIKGNRAYYSSQQDGVSSIYVVDIFGEEKNVILVSGNTYDSNNEQNEYTKNEIIINGNITKIGDRIIEKDKTIEYADKIYITDRTITTDKVIVTDSVCTVPYKTYIKVLKVSNKYLDNVYSPISYNGKYCFVVYPEEEYLVYYQSDGHMYDLKYIYENDRGYHDVFYKAEMDTLIIGTIKEIKENPYITQTADLSERQKLEFDILADFMKTNDYLYVNISTHNRFEEATKINTDREDIVVKYLINKGIKADKIVTNYSPNQIAENTLEYTILDQITLDELKKVQPPVVTIAATPIISVVFVSNIMFEINKFNSKKYDENLDVLANYLIENKDAKINIFGYTDTQGSPKYNSELSKKRANFVSEFLISKGVDKNQINVEGKGDEVQIAKNKNEKGEFIWDALAYNRRVEFVVTNQGEKVSLCVEQIPVPEEYIIENSNEATSIYSIQFYSSKENKDVTSFEGLNNVKVYKGTDGYYNYYFGEFNNISDAQKEQLKINDKYPRSIIFINNF